MVLTLNARMNFILPVIFIYTVSSTYALPSLRQGIVSTSDSFWFNPVLGIFISITSSICFVTVIIVCLCCKNRRNKLSTLSAQVERISNPFRGRRRENCSGFGLSNFSSENVSVISLPNLSEQDTPQVYFEPLPDISTLHNKVRQPQVLSSQLHLNLNEDWYVEPFKSFPRSQLQYVRKLGSGWFGQVLEGRAAGISTDHTSTHIPDLSLNKNEKYSMPVVVKVLREDASSEEQAFFLQELLPYKELEHPNILKLLAYCTETQPYLVLLQLCSKGSLKNVLREETLSEQYLMRVCYDIANGLSYMHQYNHIHTDLAARNCLVDIDYSIKLGDYGHSVEMFQEEYYLAENVAVPLRWCAPETLKCSDTTIEMMQLTKIANIWSFGVLIWEVFAKGQLPYADLDDDSVIQRVILEKNRVLNSLPVNHPDKEKILKIMRLCFLSVNKRPDIHQLYLLLTNLKQGEHSNENSFDERWQKLGQQSKSGTHNLPSFNDSHMRFESDFISGGSPENWTFTSEDIKVDENTETQNNKSDLPSWLGLEPGQTMDSLTEEITNAILRLDEALSEEQSNTPPSCNETNPSKKFISNSESGSMVNINPEEENLTQRLEDGDFSELVRIKSQSVQDFMRLTVVDEGSDSDKTSQPGSIGEHGLLPDKGYSSESNLDSAIRDSAFMVELEKLQNEHRFSIISELSKEGNSLEYHTEVDKPEDVVKVNSSISSQEDKKDINSYKDCFVGYVINDNTATLLPESPDCIVSSRSKQYSDNLPDIVTNHYSFLNDGKLEVNSIINSSSQSNLQLTVHQNSSKEKNTGNLPENINEMTLKKSEISTEGDVIFGASEDHTLDLFRPVKSASLSSDNLNPDENEEIDSPSLYNAENTNICSTFSSSANEIMDDKIGKGDIAIASVRSNEEPNNYILLTNNSTIECVNGSFPTSEQLWDESYNKKNGRDFLDPKNMIDRGNGCGIISDPFLFKEPTFISGEFWEQQMSAWQDAADQTKELLEKASHSNVTESPKTPISDEESSRSTFSSTDRLDLDDDGTYISYDADDEEVIRFNSNDLNALRIELNATLGGLSDSENVREEEPQENIIINYRPCLPVMLSPIKEEGCISDESSFSSSNDGNSSIEFVEVEPPEEFRMEILDDGNFNDNLPLTNDQATFLSEETKDSLILEDLDSNTEPRVIGMIAEEQEDFIVVDTEKNVVTLINSDRPQLHHAFLTNSLESPKLQVNVTAFDESDDVAPESLPYEGVFSENLNSESLEKRVSLEYSELPSYHSYFTSGLNSLSHPIPSLEEKPFQDSEEHISLPYDVNYLDDSESISLLAENANEKDANDQKEDNSISLTFLSHLYNESQTSSNAVKSNIPIESSSDLKQLNEEVSEVEDIPEEIVFECTEDLAESPAVTPNRLRDFVPRENEIHEEPRYTPDWETDSDDSSTSDEFVWHPGAGDNPLPICHAIEEEQMKESSLESPSNASSSNDSESGEEEFTPSIWNRELTPQRSLLKSPDTHSGLKKNVHWKYQKHHRIYEYPPEPQSWHTYPSNSNSRRSWGSNPLNYLSSIDFDLKDSYEDDDERDDSTSPFYAFTRSLFNGRDDEVLGTDCEFYIRSSGSPFAFGRSSFSPSEYFLPNSSTFIDEDNPTTHIDQLSENIQNANDVTEDDLSNDPNNPEASTEMKNLEENIEVLSHSLDNLQETDLKHGCESPPLNAETASECLNKDISCVGGFKHFKEKLRLDIPSLSVQEDASVKGEGVGSPVQDAS